MSKEGQFFHTGTVPNLKNKTYVADIRMMVHSTGKGYRPLCVYARKAREPLPKECPPDSWACLGTNLSVKLEDGKFTSEPTRLLLMDTKDFNTLGLGMDDLIDAFVQTVLASIAIDKMAALLVKSDGKFDLAGFSALNPDEAFINELNLPVGSF